MDRRKFIQKGSQIVLGSLAVPMFASSCTGANSAKAVNNTNALLTGNDELPKVYFTKEITPESLMRIYQSLGREAVGQNVAVKVTTGEPGGHNFLKPAFMRDFVQSVNGTIIECNTAYGGGRASTEDHLKAARDHGFMDIANVDIMDADGEVELPVRNGTWIKNDIVGKNYLNYDFTVILSHFKGHAMGGFGGAIKNMSMVSPRRMVRHGYILRERLQTRPKYGIISPRRMIFWRRWQKLQVPLPIMREIRLFISA